MSVSDELIPPPPAVRQELAATLPVLNGDLEREVLPAEAPRAFSSHKTAQTRGNRPRLVGKLMAIRKLAGGQVMNRDALASAAYIGISAAHATLASNPAEVFITAMYLAIAMIHLAAPYLPKDESRQARIEQ